MKKKLKLKTNKVLYKIILFIIPIVFLSACFSKNEIIEKRTGFGGKYYFYNEDNNPVLHIDLIYDNIGSNLDPKNKAGLADFVTSLLSAGNSKYTKEKFQSFLDIEGINYSFETNRDYIKLHFTCLKESQDKLFTVLNLLLMDAKFPQKELEREKQSRLGFIKTNLSNDTFLSEYYATTRFFKKPLSSLIEGSPNTIQNITREDLNIFYKKYFIRENLSVAVLGEIDDDLLKNVYAFVLNSHKGTHLIYKDYFKYNKGKTILFVNKPKVKENNVFMIFALKNISFNSNDIIFLDLFSNIFSMGMDSVLFTDVRKKQGISYGVHGSWANEGKSRLYYKVDFNPRLGLSGLGIKTVLNSLNNIIQHGVEQSDFERKKSYLKNIFLHKLATKFSILQRYTNHQLLGFKKDYDKQYIENLDKITINQMNKFIKNLFKKSDIFVSVVGDKKELEKDKELKLLIDNFKTEYIEYTKILEE